MRSERKLRKLFLESCQQFRADHCFIKDSKIGSSEKIYGEIFIPAQVQKELSSSKYSPIQLSEDWIHICELSMPLETMLSYELDRGEAEAISLAKEIKSDILIIDERKGRMIARDVYKVPIIGTCGILLRAKKQKQIDKISPFLAAMKKEGYYISDALAEEVLTAAGEN